MQVHTLIDRIYRMVGRARSGAARHETQQALRALDKLVSDLVGSIRKGYADSIEARTK